MTRRGFFKTLLALAGVVLTAPLASRAALFTNFIWSEPARAALADGDALVDLQPYVKSTPLDYQLAMHPLKDVAAVYVDGVLVPPYGSIFLGDAGRLYLPPGRLLSGDERRRLEPGRAVLPGTSLLFIPTVCLTDAEHAGLESKAKPFGIAIQKGCES